MIYYIPSTNGFVDPAVYSANVPEDAVEISADIYTAMMEGQATGLMIVSGKGGFPELAIRPALTTEELRVNALSERDRLLSYAAIRVAPLQDAADLEDATPEDVAALKLWKEYRVALNRIEGQTGFPKKIKWPVSPE